MSAEKRRKEKTNLTYKSVVAIILFSMLLMQIVGSISPVVSQEKKEIKVAMHKVKDSDVTDAQMNKWLEKANTAFGCSLKFVEDDGKIDEVEKPQPESSKDKPDPASKVECVINIYGVKNEPKSYTWPGSKGDRIQGMKYDWDYIIVDNAAEDVTLAHELGHWFCLDDDRSDKNNVMWYDGDSGDPPTVTPEQQDAVKKKAEEWQKKEKAFKEGNGKQQEDPVRDVVYEFIDLEFDRVWAEYDFLHFTLHVLSFLPNDCELGFLLESDNNPTTGEPPEGLDYFVGFNPAYDQVIFERYDEFWKPLDSTGIDFQFSYVHHKTEMETIGPLKIIIGVNLNLPFSKLDRKAGSLISFRAIGRYDTYVDTSPETGLKSIKIPIRGVGGIAVPVDKFVLLAPYIGLASTIIVATVAAAIYVKRVKHRKEKQ